MKCFPEGQDPPEAFLERYFSLPHKKKGKLLSLHSQSSSLDPSLCLKLVFWPANQESKTRFNPVLQSWLAGKRANGDCGSDTVTTCGLPQMRKSFINKPRVGGQRIPQAYSPNDKSCFTLISEPSIMQKNTIFVFVLIFHNNKVILPTPIKTSLVPTPTTQLRKICAFGMHA